MLTAKLRYRKNAKYFQFLIDTGADYTIIPKSDAYLLGVHYEDIKQKEIKLEAANLTLIKAKKVSLVLTIDQYNIAIPVLIAKNNVEPVLGRKGLFEHFDILFQERQQQVVFIV